jgi:ketosteroid isomerase-like protein
MVGEQVDMVTVRAAILAAMPEQQAAVRTPLAPRPSTTRSLDQRLALRYPGVARANLRALLRMPPSARPRRLALARIVVQALEAYNRRDLAAVVAPFDEVFEYRPERRWVEAGMVDEVYRGLAGYRRYIETVDEVWGGQNFLDATELIDLGGRTLVLADARIRAQASGVPLSEKFALVTTVRDGATAYHREYYDQDEALAAVGLA